MSIIYLITFYFIILQLYAFIFILILSIWAFTGLQNIDSFNEVPIHKI